MSEASSSKETMFDLSLELDDSGGGGGGGRHSLGAGSADDLHSIAAAAATAASAAVSRRGRGLSQSSVSGSSVGSADEADGGSGDGRGGGSGVRWVSGVACVQGLRDSNEDTCTSIDNFDELLAATAAAAAAVGSGAVADAHEASDGDGGGGDGRPPRADDNRSGVGSKYEHGFYGVYDGHCGKATSLLAAKKMHLILGENANFAGGGGGGGADGGGDDAADAIAAALSESFLALDREFLEIARSVSWPESRSQLQRLSASPPSI